MWNLVALKLLLRASYSSNFNSLFHAEETENFQYINK